MAEAVRGRIPTAVSCEQAQVRPCYFVVDEVIMGQVFSEYSAFPANSHSTNCTTFINHSIFRYSIVSIMISSLNSQFRIHEATLL
jgi:hypothetical protein